MNHLASCAYCRARMGVLSQLGGLSECEPPEMLVAKAKLLGANRANLSAKTISMRLIAPYMAAAVLIMAAGLVLTSEWWGPDRPSLQTSDTREFRSRSQETGRLELLSPAHGSEIPSGPLQVQWVPVGDSLHYEISLLNEYGDLLLQKKVTENHLNLDTEPMLQAGTKYFIHVSADLEDGRTIASPHVGFRIVNGQGNGS